MFDKAFALIIVDYIIVYGTYCALLVYLYLFLSNFAGHFKFNYKCPWIIKDEDVSGIYPTLLIFYLIISGLLTSFIIYITWDNNLKVAHRTFKYKNYYLDFELHSTDILSPSFIDNYYWIIIVWILAILFLLETYFSYNRYSGCQMISKKLYKDSKCSTFLPYTIYIAIFLLLIWLCLTILPIIMIFISAFHFIINTYFSYFFFQTVKVSYEHVLRFHTVLQSETSQQMSRQINQIRAVYWLAAISSLISGYTYSSFVLCNTLRIIPFTLCINCICLYSMFTKNRGFTKGLLKCDYKTVSTKIKEPWTILKKRRESPWTKPTTLSKLRIRTASAVTSFVNLPKTLSPKIFRTASEPTLKIKIKNKFGAAAPPNTPRLEAQTKSDGNLNLDVIGEDNEDFPDFNLDDMTTTNTHSSGNPLAYDTFTDAPGITIKRTSVGFAVRPISHLTTKGLVAAPSTSTISSGTSGTSRTSSSYTNTSSKEFGGLNNMSLHTIPDEEEIFGTVLPPIPTNKITIKRNNGNIINEYERKYDNDNSPTSSKPNITTISIDISNNDNDAQLPINKRTVSTPKKYRVRKREQSTTGTVPLAPAFYDNEELVMHTPAYILDDIHNINDNDNDNDNNNDTVHGMFATIKRMGNIRATMRDVDVKELQIELATVNKQDIILEEKEINKKRASLQAKIKQKSAVRKKIENIELTKDELEREKKLLQLKKKTSKRVAFGADIALEILQQSIAEEEEKRQSAKNEYYVNQLYQTMSKTNNGKDASRANTMHITTPKPLVLAAPRPSFNNDDDDDDDDDTDDDIDDIDELEHFILNELPIFTLQHQNSLKSSNNSSSNIFKPGHKLQRSTSFEKEEKSRSKSRSKSKDINGISPVKHIRSQSENQMIAQFAFQIGIHKRNKKNALKPNQYNKKKKLRKNPTGQINGYRQNSARKNKRINGFNTKYNKKKGIIGGRRQRSNSRTNPKNLKKLKGPIPRPKLDKFSISSDGDRLKRSKKRIKTKKRKVSFKESMKRSKTVNKEQKQFKVTISPTDGNQNNKVNDDDDDEYDLNNSIEVSPSPPVFADMYNSDRSDHQHNNTLERIEMSIFDTVRSWITPNSFRSSTQRSNTNTSLRDGSNHVADLNEFLKMTGLATHSKKIQSDLVDKMKSIDENKFDNDDDLTRTYNDDARYVDFNDLRIDYDIDYDNKMMIGSGNNNNNDNDDNGIDIKYRNDPDIDPNINNNDDNKYDDIDIKYDEEKYEPKQIDNDNDNKNKNNNNNLMDMNMDHVHLGHMIMNMNQMDDIKGNSSGSGSDSSTIISTHL